ncbi:hypothetical protein ACTS95_14600 [Empedobacter brevis]
MKKLLVFFIFSIHTFSFCQEVYNPKNVDQFAIYPSCEVVSDNYLECFNHQLNEDVSERLSKIKMDKILQDSGEYFAKLNFVIDENGDFITVTSQGDETLARISTQILYKINREQNENASKIKPALINGTPVKVNFSLSIRYHNK